MFRTLIYPSSGACDFAETSACNTDTTQNQPHQISNTQWTDNTTTDVVIQQQSRKLLMMDILMSETCWAHKKWNKIASDIKLVFYSSTTILKFCFFQRTLGKVQKRNGPEVSRGTFDWLSSWYMHTDGRTENILWKLLVYDVPGFEDVKEYGKVHI